MFGMMGRAIDDAFGGHEEAVVDGDGPAVDKDKHDEVGDLVDGEEEGVGVVGCALRKAIERVESMRSPGRRHLPQMVNLMNGP